jgi:hypothetical protein
MDVTLAEVAEEIRDLPKRLIGESWLFPVIISAVASNVLLDSLMPLATDCENVRQRPRDGE